MVAEPLLDPDDLSVGDYLGHWLRHARGRVRAKTHDGYGALLRIHAVPRIGAIPLAGLRALHLQRLYADLGGAPRRREEVRRLEVDLGNSRTDLRGSGPAEDDRTASSAARRASNASAYPISARRPRRAARSWAGWVRQFAG